MSQIIGELEDIYSKTVSPFTAKQEREKLLPKIKNEFKERLSSKTGTSPEEDSKGNLVDEDTKTAEMEKWTNDYLSRIFGGVIKIDNQKISIEEQKIQAQRDIADKQLQIAKENKNKYDVKGSKNKKKK